MGGTLAQEQESIYLERIGWVITLTVMKSGARFEPDKTKWYNQHYWQRKKC